MFCSSKPPERLPDHLHLLIIDLISEVIDKIWEGELEITSILAVGGLKFDNRNESAFKTTVAC